MWNNPWASFIPDQEFVKYLSYEVGWRAGAAQISACVTPVFPIQACSDYMGHKYPRR